jgi:hypothetical protein
VTSFSHRIDAWLWALLAAAAVFAAVLVAPRVLAGGDLYWHIAAGRWMIENQQVLRIDPFSSTFQGQPWETRDWLAEILFAAAYVGAGWGGVLALAAAAAASGAGLLAFHLARGRRDVFTAIWLALAVITAADAVKALPFLLALPCLVAWTGGLSRAVAKGPSLRLLPVILVWANLSSSFVIGLALTVVLAAEAILIAKENRLAVARSWAVFAGCALILGLVTPTGAPGMAHAIRALGVTGPVGSLLPLLIALPAASVLLPRRLLWLRLVFLAGLFMLALTSALGRLFFAATAPLLCAGPHEDEELKLQWRPLTTLVLLAIIAAAVRIAVPVERHDDATTPQTALAEVPVTIKRQPVFNDTAFGGFLIFSDVRPFLDSRPLYFESFRNRYAAVTTPGLLANTLTRYHVRWTILAPDNPAVKLMDGMTGWHRLYRDQWAVVHVKNGAR